MRAPPESLIPMHGHPVLCARSMILVTFSANTSPSEPPKTDASWLKTKTCLPSIVPQPVTTPSPRILRSSIPKLVVRCMAKTSISVNDPASRSRSMRSRAVSFFFACWERCAAPPRWIASYRRLRSMLIFRSVPPLDPLDRASSASAGSKGSAASSGVDSSVSTGRTSLRACLVTASGYSPHTATCGW